VADGGDQALRLLATYEVGSIDAHLMNFAPTTSVVR
jgi:hypothetical protein